MTDNRRALVRYRLEQAQESLESARILLEHGKLRPAVNRAYYTMFYAVLALAATTGRSLSKHAGAVAMFDVDFVKPGAFDRELSRWLHEAFDLRQRSDYRELFEVSQERASSVVTRTRSLRVSTRDSIARVGLSDSPAAGACALELAPATPHGVLIQVFASPWTGRKEPPFRSDGAGIPE